MWVWGEYEEDGVVYRPLEAVWEFVISIVKTAT